MTTHSTLSSTLGCFALIAITVGAGTQALAQQSLRLPQITVQSPLFAIAPPTPPPPAVDAAKAEAAKVEAPKAAVAKPEMRVPAETIRPPAPRTPAKGGANMLLPPKAVQPMALQPDPNMDLKKLIDEAQNAPAAAQVTISRNTEVIKSLAGITLFKDDRKNPTDTPSAIPSTLAPGVNIAPDLTTPEREALVALLQQKYLGKSVSFEGMDQIVKDILAFYSSKKRPMTHVYIPEQEISDKLKIAVLEGRLGDVRFSNGGVKRRWYQAPLPAVPKALVTQQGQILDMNSIGTALAQLNMSPWSRLGREEAHPYHRASLAMTPGAQLGLTDIELAVQSRAIIPIQTFAGWDNTGTVSLGENRFNVGSVWYDAFNTGYNHQMGLQFQSAENYDLFHSVIASYTIPIARWNQSFQIFGAYMQSSVDIPTNGVPQTIKGDAMIIGARYYFKLPTWYMTQEAKMAESKTKQLALYHDLGIGFDYKSQNNNLFFGGINVFPTQIEVAQYVAEYNVRQTDKWGETNLSLAYFYSPGQLARNNTDADFLAARTGGTADYSYARGTFSRMVDLGALTRQLKDFKLMTRATGQWSNSNLVASEQLGLGGNASVRGYPERTMRGDRGIFVQTELYFPAIHPLQFLAKKTPDRWTDVADRTDELRFLVFYDYGWGDTVKPTPAEPGSILNLSSIGVGLRYRYNKSMTFRFDYGYQLEKLDPRRVNAFDLSPKYSNNGDGYAHMGLSISF